MNTIKISTPPTFVEHMDRGQLAETFHKNHDTFEPETLRVWGQVALRGSEVFDVGSHTGVFAIAAAKLGARPVAIEPLPFLVEIIKEHARLNRVEFYICEAAASDEKGNARIGYRTDVELPCGASLKRTDKPVHENIVVKTVRLDDFKMSKLSAIKIDVERCEVAVLKGAKKTLARHRPVIILEALNDRARHKTTELLQETHRFVRALDRRNILFEPI